MSGIIYIDQISRSNLSTLESVDLSGVVQNIISSAEVDLLKISSINATYTTGSTIIYVPNYPPLQERSTMNAIKEYFDKLNNTNISTSIGVMRLPITMNEKLSTLVGLSTNSFALTLEDVLKVTNGYLATEAANKLSLKGLDQEVLKSNLYAWAAKGFPASYRVYQLNFTVPSNTGLIPCSDAVPRNTSDYVVFCLGTPIQELVDSYNTIIEDITLTYSVEGNSVVLSVNRNA